MKKGLLIHSSKGNEIINNSVKELFHLSTQIKDVLYAVVELSYDFCQNIQEENLIKNLVSHDIKVIATAEEEDKNLVKWAYRNGCSSFYRLEDLKKNGTKILEQEFLHVDVAQYLLHFENKFITKNRLIKNKVGEIAKRGGRVDRILLTGPTGVGKTTLAKLIHNLRDPNAPFVHVNLSELPENLIESELFGHKKGSFTGAHQDKEGLVKLAEGGTLFLDEIGTIPLNLQKKLLKVIEEKKYYPVGSTCEVHTNFWLMSATCDDLKKQINSQDFRLDLFYRICGVEIKIPALQKRKEDIIPLIDYFVQQTERKIVFSDRAIDALLEHPWKGNIRELSGLVTELSLFSDGFVKKEDLPFSFCNENKGAQKFIRPKMKEYIDQHGLVQFLKEIKKEAVAMAIADYGGRINEISRRLKISKTLFYSIKGQLD